MKLFKRLIAILTIIAVISALPFAAAVNKESASSAENLPIVYIGGKGTTLIDADGERFYPMSVDVMGIAKKVVPALVKANIAKQYDDFCDVLYDAVSEEFAMLPLDGNGNAKNGTGTDFKWTKQDLSYRVKTDEPYKLWDYVFYYDWRLDPCEIADSFASYIDDVLEVTNAPKVKIVARCLGGDIVLAYLDEYGSEKVDHCLLYVSTIKGVAGCGAAFAGDLTLDNAAITRFAADLGMDPIFSLGDDLANDLAAAIVNILSKTYGLEYVTSSTEEVYAIVKDDIVPRLLLATFATFPSYWSMVGDDYYEAAKDCSFAGKKDEYAGLIRKIDNYHYNIQRNSDNILKAVEASGTAISVICKYGVQQVPISKETEILSDDTVSLESTSFGANCTSLFSSFSDEYVAASKSNGTAKYISPDRQVDCSTCLFPDYTWVVKNCTHTDFPTSIDELILEILRYDGRMTVDSNAKYPQYLLYNKAENKIAPLTSDNCDTSSERWSQSMLESIITVVKTVYELIKRAIADSIQTK